MPQTKRGLSAARRELVGLFQQINFGRVERLVIRYGEPVLDPAPAAVSVLKFPGDNSPRPEAARDDYALKVEVVAFFAALDRLGTGVLERVEVRHGLPVTAEIRHQ